MVSTSLSRVLTWFKHQPWLPIVGIVIIWRLVVWFVGSAAFVTLQPGPVPLYGQISPIWEIWTRFDGGWYASIAQSGYHGAGPQSFVFFPLFPALIRLGSVLTHWHLFIVEVVIANAFTVFAVLRLEQLVALDFDTRVQQRALRYFLLSPMAIFLAVGYTEPLFCWLAFSAFVAARKGRWAWAAAFAAGASASRLVGIVVGLALIVEYLDQIGWRWRTVRADILWFTLAPLGLAAYSTYGLLEFHDPLIFLHAYQGTVWQRTPFSVAALYPFVHRAVDMLNLHLITTDLGRFVGAYNETFLGILSIVIAAVALWRVRISYGVLTLGLLAVPLLSGNASSLNRFTLPLFPVFIVLALWGRRPLVDWIVTLISALLLGLTTALFVSGYWIA